jgi:hypothetical protein
VVVVCCQMLGRATTGLQWVGDEVGALMPAANQGPGHRAFLQRASGHPKPAKRPVQMSKRAEGSVDAAAQNESCLEGHGLAGHSRGPESQQPPHPQKRRGADMR